MRILLIHQIFVTPQEGGGTRHYEMCYHLVRLGHDVSVIASEMDYLTGKKRSIQSEIKDGIKIYYAAADSEVHKSIFHRSINFFSFSYHAYKLAMSLGKFDIIWGTSPPLFQAYSASRFASKFRIPFVFEVRDLWIDFARQLKIINNPLVYLVFKKIEKWIYHRADYIIVNSPGFVSHIQKIVGKKNIEIFVNGVEIDNFKKTDKNILNNFVRTHKIENKFIVMYAGNIGVANDIDNILNAARQLNSEYPDIVFTFLGGGINAEKYKIAARKEGLENVVFIPPQPKKDMPSILKAADVCLATLKPIPLFKTNYPNKVFDYMAAGRPTVLAIDGVMRDVVEKAKGGVFAEPGNPDSLKNAVLYYYENKDLIEKHGKNAQNYVTKHFNRKFITENFVQYLTSLNEN